MTMNENSNEEYRFANIPTNLLEKIRQLETELAAELDESIVLLAYEKKHRNRLQA
ncbi:hypothetical protein ACOJUR_08945 [Alicyclobacillus tolerans]|uniref:Uncharacterized protein n=1 Tax=Alicyclobacillus tolerans TaxID=90970 RepID=A0ABT9LVG7_9BACL|nr:MULTISPECIES: hypothetical protein [Alicyclobacillus]MDP9728255.1 hypothetical protein [Alicyclobacillus tengchongensis]